MNFNFWDEYQKMLTPEIVGYLSDIHEYKGKQFYYTEVKKDVLDEMLDSARFQSIERSNRMEGISTSDHRLKALAADKGKPKEENEKQLAGYRDVWNTIHKNYKYHPLTPETILEFHQILYKYCGTDNKGKFRNMNHIDPSELSIKCACDHFTPLQYEEIPDAVRSLCDAFNQAKELMDPLLLIPMFICDFLLISPFAVGNGKMSRLLLLLLLAQCGYYVGSYCSLEKRIEESSSSYRETVAPVLSAAEKTSMDYAPFTLYLLRIISETYRDFAEQISIMGNSELSKVAQVRETIMKIEGEFTKAEIAERCLNISEKTMQRAFELLIKTKRIKKNGGGRYTTYIWNGEKQ